MAMFRVTECTTDVDTPESKLRLPRRNGTGMFRPISITETLSEYSDDGRPPIYLVEVTGPMQTTRLGDDRRLTGEAVWSGHNLDDALAERTGHQSFPDALRPYLAGDKTLRHHAFSEE